MNSKAMGLSLIMAGIAVFFVVSSVNSIEDQARKRFGNEVTVLVAKRDIKEMDTITDAMIEPKSIPKQFVEPSAISFNVSVDENSKEYGMEIRRLLGNVAVVSIKQGEQLALNKITEPSLRTGLSPQITPGKRAIAISVDETSSVAKLVKPGDRIDLIAVIDMGGGAGGRDNKVSKTVLQDVVVLAVGRSIANNLPRKVDIDVSTGKSRVKSLTEYDGFSSVTLEVDPAQAQLLAAISTGGMNKLVLTLRNNDDTDRSNYGVSRVTDALGDSARMPAAAGSMGGAR